MQIAEGVEWIRVHWVTGHLPKQSRFRNAIKDPPCNGAQHAFLLRGEKMSTLFCPHSMMAYTVHNDCSEIALAKEDVDFRSDAIRNLLEHKWVYFQGRGHQRDYDTCALVMRRMGWDVPAQVAIGGEEDTRKTSGKKASKELTKPVKRKSRRGKFLTWSIGNENGRPVRETMAELAMSRSSVLSYLNRICDDHGIGYEIVGDVAKLLLPPGCSDPFDTPPEDDFDWLDDDEFDWLD